MKNDKGKESVVKTSHTSSSAIMNENTVDGEKQQLILTLLAVVASNQGENPIRRDINHY